jgi:undecaprenyl-diphosphatase
MPRHQVAVAALVSCTLRRLRIPGANAVGLAGATAMAADAILKVTLPRRRPRVYPGSRIDESFPSGHATTTTAVTLTLADVLERAGIVDAPRATIAAVAVTVFISGSRLLLDEHWPSDVVAGVVLGFAISRSVRADAPATRRGRLTNEKRKTVERIAEATP